MNDPVINGNILTVFGKDMMNICSFALQTGITVFSVRPEGDHYQISFPITKDIEANIPGMIHGARGRLKALEQSESNPTPPNSAA